MKKALEQGVLKYLAGVALAFTAGTADPAPELLKVPASLLTEVVEDVEESDWQPEARRRMLDLLVHDPRPAVRVRVCEALAGLWGESPDQVTELLRTLSHDGSAIVQAAAARGFGDVLARASALERIELVAEWTLSEEPAERQTLARALSATTPVLIGDLAIDQLTIDRDPAVRRWALVAAESHMRENPDFYLGLAIDLLDDPDPEVREEARRILAAESA